MPLKCFNALPPRNMPTTDPQTYIKVEVVLPHSAV
jgi:hypothetical protein